MNRLRVLCILLFAVTLLSCGGGSSTGSNPNPNPNPNPGADNVAPSVALSAPAGGASVTGISSLSATASDNVAVAGVQFLYDGQPLGSEILFPPYTVAWNTTTSVNGSHMITVRARDAAGNQATTAPISVTITNGAPPAVSSTFALQTSQRFQTWHAWMGASPGPYFPTPSGYILPPTALLNSALDEVVFDLGINGLRIHTRGQQAEAVNDNADPFTINAAGFDFSSQVIAPDGEIADPVKNMQMIVLPFRQRVLARNEPFVSYVTHRFNYFTIPSHWHIAEEYAEMAEAYVNWMSTNFSFTPTYYAIANEPESGFYVTGELTNDIVAVGRRFQQRGWATRMQTPESIVPDANALQTALSNSSALQFTGMAAFHSYDYFGTIPSTFSTRNAFRTMARSFNLPIAMSEICCRGWNGSYTGQGLAVARDIYWNMTEADISIWAQFALIYTCPQVDCTSGAQQYVNIDPDFSRNYKMPAYYALRQFSRYIRPGAVRVGLTCSGCSSNVSIGRIQKAVAFQSAAGKYTVVAINDQGGAAAFAINGLPAGTYEITGVDPAHTDSMAFSPVTISAGQSLRVTFAGQAIITLVQR